MAAKQGLEIDVKGEVELLLPAERAVLSITVNAEGLEKAEITNAIVGSARKVETALRKVSARTNDNIAPVDYWCRTSLQESSHVPYDSDRKVDLPRKYQSWVDFQIHLQKFSRLGPVIHDLVEIEHASSQGVEWILTPDTKEAQRSKLRTLAAKNALNKAEEYAKALGYDKVVAMEMKEAQAYTRSSSMKGRGREPTDGVETQSKNMAEGEEWEDLSEEAFEYTPEDVKMSQSVNAKFRAE